jgi:hypothetical protein
MLVSDQPEVRLRLSEAQGEVHNSPARFRVLVAGRRFGKTQLALVELLQAACNDPGRVCCYLAPSYRQAKRIAWERLKAMALALPRIHILETDLTLRLPNGSSISLRGVDNYDSLRGSGLDFVVLDEFASMKPEVWSEIIRPALADRKGRALFIGTPQGHDHLYDRFQFAQSQPDWSAFHFTTLEGGHVTAEELAGAARELDERLYRQEFEASFESMALGLAYYAFSREENVRPCRYTPGARIIWSLDFNVHPMCSIIAQRYGETVEVLEELVLDHANTVAACERFWERARAFPRERQGVFQIEIYGDASGHQRRTCGTATDWQIIREFFAARYGQASATIRAAQSNPGIRDRINIVNGRLRSASGDNRLFIDPKCRQLILDFERVCWMQDAHGQPTAELEKFDRLRTHTSDALGYYLVQAFPLTPKIGERMKPLF